MLAGIEFAADLARRIDPFRAGKVDSGLHHFIRDVRAALRMLKSRAGNS